MDIRCVKCSKLFGRFRWEVSAWDHRGRPLAIMQPVYLRAETSFGWASGELIGNVGRRRRMTGFDDPSANSPTLKYVFRCDCGAAPKSRAAAQLLKDLRLIPEVLTL